MNKAEIASYLMSLQGLLEAQTKGSHSLPATQLAEEYDKHWDLLKKEIEKDKEDEKKHEDRRQHNGDRNEH